MTWSDGWLVRKSGANTGTGTDPATKTVPVAGIRTDSRFILDLIKFRTRNHRLDLNWSRPKNGVAPSTRHTVNAAAAAAVSSCRVCCLSVSVSHVCSGVSQCLLFSTETWSVLETVKQDPV